MARQIHALVPIKPLASAKSRLGRALPPASRIRLVRWLLRRVLRVLGRCRTIRLVWVVGGDQSIRRLCAKVGVRYLPELERSLNGTLHRALEYLGARGATHALIIPPDLPFLRCSHVRRLVVALSSDGVVIAPARDGGTNAMLLPIPAPLRPAFGPRSAEAHVRRARRRGLAVRMVTDAALAFDVDTPADLRLLADRNPRGMPKSVIRPMAR